MPYIKGEYDRGTLRPLCDRFAENAGELNYQLTCVIQDYIQGNRPSYATFNDIVGALECCKHEFIRRVVNPYEDKKIEENGDVY